MADDKTTARRTKVNWMQSLGIFPDPKSNKKKDDDQPKWLQEIRLTQYSDHELYQIPGTTMLNPEKRKPNAMQDDEIKDPTGVLKEVSEHSKDIIKTTRGLYALNPEVGYSKHILVSSIMSPNDMQSGSLPVVCDLEELEDNPIVQSNLNEYLTRVYDKSLELGVKFERWLGECLFDTGSVSVLVLPRPEIAKLTYDPSTEAGLESIDISFSTDEVSANVSLENEVLDEFNNLEEFAIVSTEARRNIAKAVIKANSSKLPAVKITHKATEIANRATRLKKTATEGMKKINDQLLKMAGDKNMWLLDESFDSLKQEKDSHPAWIEIPTHAVIPVTVPGSPAEHIGYFVLVDEWGTPVHPERYIKTNCTSNSSQLVKESEYAFFKRCDQSQALSKLTQHQQFSAMSTVFGIAIKNMMERSMDTMGYKGVKLERYNTISKCIFYHALHNQKVKLVFVPEPLMVYYRFDHRPDGTGKSMVEDIEYLLALRTTMHIARVMSAIKNATDSTTIGVKLDAKDKNIIQTLETIKQQYILKNAPKIDHNPDSIFESLTGHGLKIVPENIPGLTDNLTITKDQRSGNSPAPDDTLAERFDDMIALSFHVPPSALNRLSEDEYSRSVATNNLFFSNKLRYFQRIATKHNNKLVRNTLRYSPCMQKDIVEIFSNGGITNPKKLLQRVYENITAVLSSPTISAGKAQYEELREKIDSIDLLMDKTLPDELFGTDDRETRELMQTYRAHARAKLVRKFVSDLGLQGVLEIPTIEEINPSEIRNINLAAINMKKGLTQLKKALAPDAEADAGGGGRGW